MEDKEFVNLTPETENMVENSAADSEELLSAEEELRSAAVSDEKNGRCGSRHGRGNFRDRGGYRPHLKPRKTGHETVFPL